MSSADSIINKRAETEVSVISEIKSRWSPRVFLDTKLNEGDWAQLFEAARWAASSYNAQPWRFIYATRGSDAYQKIFNCLSEFNQKWCKYAPHLILTAYKEKFDNGKDNFHALHDLGQAVANMSLQAQSMGIALHQMAGVDWKKASEIFEVPDGYHVTTAIAVGYYGGDIEQLPEDMQKKERAERSRMAQEEFAFQEIWQEEE